MELGVESLRPHLTILRVLHGRCHVVDIVEAYLLQASFDG